MISICFFFLNSISLTSLIVYISSLCILRSALKIFACVNALAKSKVKKYISLTCGKTKDFFESALLFLFRNLGLTCLKLLKTRYAFPCIKLLLIFANHNVLLSDRKSINFPLILFSCYHFYFYVLIIELYEFVFHFINSHF